MMLIACDNELCSKVEKVAFQDGDGIMVLLRGGISRIDWRTRFADQKAYHFCCDKCEEKHQSDKIIESPTT